MTPVDLIVGFWRWFWITVLAVALVIIVIIGGAHLGWWLQGQAANHQAVNTQYGYSNQTTLRAELASDLATVTSLTTQIAEAGSDASLVAALKPQRAAIAGKACTEADEISDGLPADQAQWAAANCTDGSLSPQSSLYQPGTP